MKRLAITLLLVLSTAAPAKAALQFPLASHRLDLWRDRQSTTTISQYLRTHPAAVFATASGYSDRRGMPIGLLMLDGSVRQGNYRRRCFLQFDRSGRRVEIGYQLQPWAYEAFAAGPCIVVWRNGAANHQPKMGYYIAWREERFSRLFITHHTDRSVFCIDRSRTRAVVLKFRGPLISVPQKMQALQLERCVNLDGGSQLAPTAINPAILGIMPRAADSQD